MLDASLHKVSNINQAYDIICQEMLTAQTISLYLLQRYCASLHISPVVQDVTAVNLINQHGSEGVLAKAFHEEALRFADNSQGLRLVAFDFHKQCGASKYHK